MNADIALIDKAIEEHKTYLGRLKTMDDIANDAEALHGIEKAQETFVPGRLDAKSKMEELSELVESINKGLNAHFEREETPLLSVFEKHGDSEMIAGFNSLIQEHTDLRARLAETGEKINRLSGGGMSIGQWEAAAYDMRAYISHTRQLLEKHAHTEHEIFVSLRNKLENE
ncbi:hemerythrin domain-containing protein [Chloroflexota bacterium]